MKTVTTVPTALATEPGKRQPTTSSAAAKMRRQPGSFRLASLHRSLLLLAFSIAAVTVVCGQRSVNAVDPAQGQVEPASVSAPTAARAPSGPERSQPPENQLLIDAGDLLDIRVFDTPELSEKVRVDGHGEITLPVGGSIKVKGFTAEQAQTAIEHRLRQRDILRDPHLEVFVLEYATQGVTVTGEVKLPGVYPLLGKHTVVDFISVAGGLTPSASRTVTLTHQNSPAQSIVIDLSGSPQSLSQQDVPVQPGDHIVVTRAGVVYVVGDVGRPGGYLIENKETITVLQAVALAQGLNRTASLDAKLIRSTPAGRTEADLPLKKILANQTHDPTLHDGDILFVPVSSAKVWTERGVTSILQMAVGVVIYGRL